MLAPNPRIGSFRFRWLSFEPEHGVARRRFRVMLRGFILACALVALAACGQTERAPDPEAAAAIGDAIPLPQTLPAPRADALRYVGRWASSAANCASGAWVFELDGVNTAGEVSCNFNNIQITPSGYMIDASCTAEGPPTLHRIQLSFAESAQAMMVSGGPWGQEIGLVHCPAP